MESNVDSVEQLEVLRLCGENPESLWPFAEMATMIQTSAAKAGRHIDAPQPRGILRVDRSEAVPRCGLALLSADVWILLQRLLAHYN